MTAAHYHQYITTASVATFTQRSGFTACNLCSRPSGMRSHNTLRIPCLCCLLSLLILACAVNSNTLFHIVRGVLLCVLQSSLISHACVLPAHFFMQCACCASAPRLMYAHMSPQTIDAEAAYGGLTIMFTI